MTATTMSEQAQNSKYKIEVLSSLRPKRLRTHTHEQSCSIFSHHNFIFIMMTQSTDGFCDFLCFQFFGAMLTDKEKYFVVAFFCILLLVVVLLNPSTVWNLLYVLCCVLCV